MRFFKFLYNYNLLKFKYSFFKSFYYSFLKKQVTFVTNNYIFVSRSSKIKLVKNSKIIISNGNLMLRNSQQDLLIGSTLYLSDNSTFKINGIVNLWGACITVGKNAKFECGILNIYTFSKIFIKGDSKFGNNIAIARNCYISDTDSHCIYKNGSSIEITKDIIIGSDVWICTNSIILKGTIIESNAIIGANTLLSGQHITSSISYNKRTLASSDFERWEL